MKDSAAFLSVCGTCHSVSKAKKRGSGLVELILWCCFIIPGLLYSAWRRHQKSIICRKCGGHNAIPIDTERAKEILGAEQHAELYKKLQARINEERLCLYILLGIIAFLFFKVVL